MTNRHHVRISWGLPVVTLLLIALCATAVVGLLGCGKEGTDTAKDGVSTPGSTASATTQYDSALSGSGATSSTVDMRTTTTIPKGESGVLEITGLVEKPQKLTAADVEKMDVVTVKVSDSGGKQTEYRGVRLKDLFDVVGVKKEASRISMTEHTNGYKVELSLQDILWIPDSLLALGEGGKLSVVIPGFDRNAWVNDVVVMEFK